MSKSKAKPAKKSAAKKVAVKAATKKVAAKKTVKKAALVKPIKAILPPKFPAPVKTWRIYIESCAFFPTNSAEGYVDHYQSGRRAAVAGSYLLTALPLPVGAKLKSVSIHYTNTTSQPQNQVAHCQL